MKANKGFTLIELLAVIVILAIIALIATPMIMGVVATAKQGAAEQSVIGFVDAVEKQSMINELENGAVYVDGEYTVTASNGTATITLAASGSAATHYDFPVKGEIPTTVGSGQKLVIADGQVQDSELTAGGYAVEYTKSTGKAKVKTTNN